MGRALTNRLPATLEDAEVEPGLRPRMRAHGEKRQDQFFRPAAFMV